MQPTVSDTAELLRVLGEPTRLRLALVLAPFSLTVAELTELTGLAQSRISSHLARMRRLGLLAEARRGTASLQALNTPLPEPAASLLRLLQEQVDPDIQQQDHEAARALVARRRHRNGWAAGVAGEMEKHYSPGRGWEIIAHTLLPFLRLGDVLDIAAGDGVVASLLAPQASRVTCVELDGTVALAGARRLSRTACTQAHYLQADMHALPFDSHRFDTVLLLNALTYSHDANRVIAEAARMLRPGGQVALTTLDKHQHSASVATYDHCNNGFTREELLRMLASNGLQVAAPEIPCITETRPPFHQVHVLRATRAP